MKKLFSPPNRHRMRTLCASVGFFALVCGTVVHAQQSLAASTEMDRIVAAAFGPDGPGAAVLVVQNGVVTLRKGYGLANMELGVPVQPDHVFPVCSITKQFTAVSILQLAQAGKLKLDDELRAYSDYPTGDAKVTLAQLLRHTAGVPSVEEQPEWRKTWREDLTPTQILAFTREKPLAFAPGTNWKYSNTGYILLGQVIEKVSGQSYSDYVRAQIFSPAAMPQSYYPEGDKLIPRRVRGYTRAGKGWANAPYFSVTQASSAGAMLATVDDLWKWEQALRAGNLVDALLLQEAQTESELPDGRKTRYGFGWEVNKIAGHVVFAHGGGMPGFAAYAARVPDSDTYVAVLANTDSPAVPVRALVTRLLRIALGETAAASNTVPAQTIEDFVGEYRIGGAATFSVVAKDGMVYGQLGPGRRPLSAVAADEFKAPGDEMHFTFARDRDGRVDKVMVRIDGPGPDMVWARIDAAPKSP